MWGPPHLNSEPLAPGGLPALWSLGHRQASHPFSRFPIPYGSAHLGSYFPAILSFLCLFLDFSLGLNALCLLLLSLLTIIPEISFKTWRMNLEEENCFQLLSDAFQRGDHMARKKCKLCCALEHLVSYYFVLFRNQVNAIDK